MHFPTTDSFEEVFFRLQKSDGFPVWTPVCWQYDQKNGTGHATFANPFLEVTTTATFSSKEYELADVIKGSEALFQSTFDSRFIKAYIPFHNLVTKYPNWEDFRRSWLVRNNRSIIRSSIPLLVSQHPRSTVLYITIFVPKTSEFYSFGIADSIEGRTFEEIRADLNQLVKDTYAF